MHCKPTFWSHGHKNLTQGIGFKKSFGDERTENGDGDGRIGTEFIEKVDLDQKNISFESHLES